jgi:hypothetical protein
MLYENLFVCHPLPREMIRVIHRDRLVDAGGSGSTVEGHAR